jgi:hypothetical protein
MKVVSKWYWEISVMRKKKFADIFGRTMEKNCGW